MRLDQVANAERYSTSVANLQVEIQNLEYTKNEEINDLLNKGGGRPSLDTTSQVFGGSGFASQANPLIDENVAARPIYDSIFTPPTQRFPIEKALEEETDAMEDVPDQARHAAPKVHPDSFSNQAGKSDDALADQLLALVETFGKE